jgi:ABC-type glycerol-3-phosphate transport system substrate-binding protein
MREKKSIFQVIVLAVFGVFIIIGVLIFASLSGGGDDQDIGTVVLWGTFDRDLMNSFLRALGDEDERTKNIKYEEHALEDFQADLVEALANGTGPDLFLLDQAHLLRHWDKIEPYSYELMSERIFKDTFVDEGEMFLSQAGIRGLPFSLDPLVLYWNRDIFAEAGFANPPQYWDEFFLLAERITKRDKANNVELATIAFGEFDNVNHAKDILSALIMQVGGEIAGRNEAGALYTALAPSSLSTSEIVPAQTALRFYTEFANPIKTVYTWNRSLPNSIDAFAQNKLAMYVGYASELRTIQAKNAHLNFDVAVLPQVRAGENKRVLTFGRLYSLAVPRVSGNKYGGVQMGLFLSGPVASEIFSEVFAAASPRRGILAKTPDDPIKLIFRNSALISRAWLDPHAEETNLIFRRMVGDVTSGTMRISDAVQNADQEMDRLVSQ